MQITFFNPNQKNKNNKITPLRIEHPQGSGKHRSKSHPQAIGHHQVGCQRTNVITPMLPKDLIHDKNWVTWIYRKVRFTPCLKGSL